MAKNFNVQWRVPMTHTEDTDEDEKHTIYAKLQEEIGKIQTNDVKMILMQKQGKKRHIEAEEEKKACTNGRTWHCILFISL